MSVKHSHDSLQVHLCLAIHLLVFCLQHHYIFQQCAKIIVLLSMRRRWLRYCICREGGGDAGGGATKEILFCILYFAWRKVEKLRWCYKSICSELACCESRASAQEIRSCRCICRYSNMCQLQIMKSICRPSTENPNSRNAKH